MLGFKTLTAPGVRSDHARPQDNTGTDMPVLLPFRAKHNKDGFFVHHDGRLFVDMKLRHGLMIFAVFALCLNALAVGAPLDPTLRIFSGVLPAAFWRLIRLRLA